MATIDPARTVLLIMDYQQDIVANFAGSSDGLLDRAASVLAEARRHHIPIVYVVVQFRAGYPEIPDRGLFRMVRESKRFVEGTDGAAIHAAVAPHEGDVIVTKRRVGAFSGSDLDCVLRGLGRPHLVLFGIATSGVVLSTVRTAADLDYEMNVIADCCGDRDAEVHGVLTEKVFTMMAPSITAADFIAAVREGARRA